jgi:hypothetical protein
MELHFVVSVSSAALSGLRMIIPLFKYANG